LGGGWRETASFAAFAVSLPPDPKGPGVFVLGNGTAESAASFAKSIFAATVFFIVTTAHSIAASPSTQRSGIEVAVESTASDGIPTGVSTAQYRRIVALSPAVTEVVYAVGGQGRLVGIAQFSDYPPQAMKEKPVVGGILNVDTERILALRPDLILTPPGAMASEKLDRLGVKIQYTPDKTLDDITSSFVTIGEVVGRLAEGQELANRFKSAVAAARERNSRKEPIKTLLVIGYEPLWVAGGYGALDELLAAAGGMNAAGGVKKDFYAADIETVVVAKPEVIVDLTLRSTDPQARRDAIKAFWSRFGSVPAVKNGRIEFIDIDLLTIPGPRLLDGLTALEDALQGKGARDAKR
jgi:iron complex transport system substrate-binding protein